MKAHTLDRAFRLWETSSEYESIQDVNLMKYLRTSLKKYVLPELGTNTAEMTPSEFGHFCTTVSIKELKGAIAVFNKNFDKAVADGKVSKSTKGNYSSALNRFLSWTQRQIWWQEYFFEEVEYKYLPKKIQVTNPVRRKKGENYGLNRNNLPKALEEQLKGYKSFRLNGKRPVRIQIDGTSFKKPKLEKISLSGFLKEEDRLLRYLGWCVNIHGIPFNDIRLDHAINVDLISEFNSWSINDRGNCHATGSAMANTSLAIAQFLKYDEVKRTDWGDIELIGDLKELRDELINEYDLDKQQNYSEKWPEKLLTFDQARQVAHFLKQFSCPRDNGGYLRPLSSTSRAYQTYLIVLILVYCPVRQEEIRQYKYNSTLFRRLDENKKPYYEVVIKEHKLFDKTRKYRHYKLPSILAKELDSWLFIWRPKIEEALKTDEGWAKFWGYSLAEVEHKKQLVRQLGDEASKNIKKAARVWENKVNARGIAKANYYKDQTLFFSYGSNYPDLFGLPLQCKSLTKTVVTAVRTATKVLFGKEKSTNPHAFRHIAEKHIRSIRPGDKAKFGVFIGHNEKTGDEYAKQITSEYEITSDFVDEWWEENT